MMTREEIDKYMDENDEKIRQMVAWMDYEIGFSGHGTTMLDKCPDFEKPTDIPDDVINDLKLGAEQWKKTKQDIFRMACIETIGEDPNDWNNPRFLDDLNDAWADAFSE